MPRELWTLCPSVYIPHLIQTQPRFTFGHSVPHKNNKKEIQCTCFMIMKINGFNVHIHKQMKRNNMYRICLLFYASVDHPLDFLEIFFFFFPSFFAVSQWEAHGRLLQIRWSKRNTRCLVSSPTLCTFSLCVQWTHMAWVTQAPSQSLSEHRVSMNNGGN